MNKTATTGLVMLVAMAPGRMAVAGSPVGSVAAAIADLRTLPDGLRARTRYLSLYNVEPQRRKSVTAAASYLVNAVGRARLIQRPVEVAGGLLRLDLAAMSDAQAPSTYGAVRAAWEQLAREDPYFHLRTQVATADGLATVTVDGGWIPAAETSLLRQLSGSLGAVLRADFFVSRVARPPAYYAFAGVPAAQGDLFLQLGLDVETVNRLAADSAANLLRSGVTGKPRRVIYRPGPLGGVWVTKDVAVVAADKDPLRTPIDFRQQRFDFDASEIFFARANGLWGTALYDANGVRQDAVPAAIASDTTAPAGQQELVPIISCIRCHEGHGGADGLQPFVDDQSALPPVRSQVAAVQRRAAELYDPERLAVRMRRDRQDYARAVDAATGGLSTDEAATALAQTFAGHAYQPVTIDSAAAETGLTADALRAALSGTRDPMLLALLRGLGIDRASWESSFQEAMLRAASQ